MNARRFTCCFLGAWLAAGIAVALIVFLNTQSIETSMERVSPVLTAQLKIAGSTQTRVLFALQVSEQNRLYLESWGTAQVAAGALFLFFLVFGTHEGKGSLAIAAVLLLVVIVQRAFIIPEMTSLSRLLAAGGQFGAHERLSTVQLAYNAMEGTKLLVGLGVAGKLVREGRPRSRYAGKDVDVIDKSYHRHIDR